MKRLQLIMYVKQNMQAVGQNPESMPVRVATEEFANEEYRKDGNLYFDQSVFHKNQKSSK